MFLNRTPLRAGTRDVERASMASLANLLVQRPLQRGTVDAWAEMAKTDLCASILTLANAVRLQLEGHAQRGAMCALKQAASKRTP